MGIKFGIVVFPGSNCDHDAYYALKKILDSDSVFLWHKDNDLQDCDVIVLPGGFSYGDYLRSGAIGRFSPIMKSVIEFANKGGYVIGICNGFQVLLEAGLLPGVLMKNESIKFVCKDVYLKIDNFDTPFTGTIQMPVLKIPVAHGEGNYYASDDELKMLEDKGQILFRYSNSRGEITDESNPNGSSNNIAGIVNRQKNILGMMPHPERCTDPVLGNTDGAEIFKSLINSL
jgi:phosphoribosylformylglycinamidine synthase